MDRKETWSKSLDWPFPGYKMEDINIIAHSDGGARWSKCSSAAWVVQGAIYSDGHWSHKVLSQGGVYLDTPVSSFSAECYALESCLDAMKKLLLEERSAHEPPWKRFRRK